MADGAGTGATTKARRSGWALWSYVPRAFPYLRPHKRKLAFSGLLSLLNTFVHLAQPWPLAIMIDSVVHGSAFPPLVGDLLPHGRYTQLGILVGAGFALTVLGNGLHVWQVALDAKIEQRMVLDFRSDLFQHAQRLSLAFHDQRRTGELMNRINYAAASVGTVVMAFPPMLQALLSLVGMLAISVPDPVAARAGLADRRPVPLLLGRPVRQADDAAAPAGAGARVAVALDRPRGDGDAARDRLVRA